MGSQRVHVELESEPRPSEPQPRPAQLSSLAFPAWLPCARPKGSSQPPTPERPLSLCLPRNGLTTGSAGTLRGTGIDSLRISAESVWLPIVVLLNK